MDGSAALLTLSLPSRLRTCRRGRRTGGAETIAVLGDRAERLVAEHATPRRSRRSAQVSVPAVSAPDLALRILFSERGRGCTSATSTRRGVARARPRARRRPGLHRRRPRRGDVPSRLLPLEARQGLERDRALHRRARASRSAASRATACAPASSTGARAATGAARVGSRAGRRRALARARRVGRRPAARRARAHAVLARRRAARRSAGRPRLYAERRAGSRRRRATVRPRRAC